MPKNQYGASVRKTSRTGWVRIDRVSRAKHTGTQTNNSVRKFSNSGGRIPKEVTLSLRYQSDDGTSKFRSMTVSNPKVARGKKYDAGHKIGQQNGGSGTDRRNIFPQHPVVNRFPVKGAPYTLSQNWTPKKNVHSWRQMEDKISRKREKYGSIEVGFKVNRYHK